MNHRMFQFAGLDDFLNYFDPKSPMGKSLKSERIVFYNDNELESLYDRIEILKAFVQKNGEKKDKIEFHLQRSPLVLDRFIKGELRSELHNIKKLLHNYRAICELLNRELIGEFQFDFNPDPILLLLGYEDDQLESFYIRDNFSPELKDVRRKLRDINRQLTLIKEKQIQLIRDTYTLDFRFNDFLVIDEAKVPPGSEQMIYVEPYDSDSVIVKPQLGQEYYGVHNSAKKFLHKERALEEKILLDLAEKIEKERPALNQVVQSLCDLDMALARAKVALQFHCVRPRFAMKGTISITALNFVPLKERCNRERKNYTPLTANFNASNIVINGSNMGGKTVVLKSLLFAQLLAQMGFFVPAESFESLLFRSINLIGDSIESGDSGLSSFGEEIMSLIEGKNEGNTLYVIDEFARTTNSVEAYALNSALLRFFSESDNIWSFTSTHQESLPEFQNVSFWLMKGLDYEKYGHYFHSDFNGDLNERTALINNYMDYHIEPKKKNSPKSRDALKIADILGLDSKLIKYAEKYIEKQE